MQSRSLIQGLLWMLVFINAVPTYSSPTRPIKKGLGQLKKVEDGVYPMVVLTLEMAKGSVETFNLNLEEVKTFNKAKLKAAIGKELAINYEVETTNDLLSLRCKGKSVFATEGYKKKPGLQTVKGILSDAEHETESDLPDELLITTVEKVTYHFPFYITADIVAVNGKEVVGYYTKYTRKHITALKLIGK